MRGETWMSLAVCLIGPVLPIAYLTPSAPGRLGVVLICGGAAVLPFGVIAMTALAVRRDLRASRAAAAVEAAALLIGLAGWGWATQGGDGLSLAVGMLFVPTAQLRVWLLGAVISGRGRRPRR